MTMMRPLSPLFLPVLLLLLPNAPLLTVASASSASASVSTDKHTYGPDDSIAVSFVNPSGRADDWIGIYPSDAATTTTSTTTRVDPTNDDADGGSTTTTNRTVTTVPSPSVEWLWLCGARDDGCGGEMIEKGTVEFVWEDGGILERPPPPPGEYRAFLALSSDPPPYVVVAASDVFEVVGTEELIDEWNGEEEMMEELEEELEEGELELPGSGDGDDDEWMQGWDDAAEGSAASASEESAEEGPAEEEEDMSVISTDKDRYDPASSRDDSLIEVAFSNPAAMPDDWIGIYPEESIEVVMGGEMEEFLVVPGGSADWAYACGDRDCVGATPESALSFEADTISSGIYLAVLAMNAPDPPYPVLALSDPFEVVGDLDLTETNNDANDASSTLQGGGGDVWGGEGGEELGLSGSQEGLGATAGNGGGSGGGIWLSKSVVLAVCAALLVGNAIACLWFKYGRSSSSSSSGADETPNRQYGKIELSTYT